MSSTWKPKGDFATTNMQNHFLWYGNSERTMQILLWWLFVLFKTLPLPTDFNVTWYFIIECLRLFQGHIHVSLPTENINQNWSKMRHLQKNWNAIFWLMRDCAFAWDAHDTSTTHYDTLSLPLFPILSPIPCRLLANSCSLLFLLSFKIFSTFYKLFYS